MARLGSTSRRSMQSLSTVVDKTGKGEDQATAEKRVGWLKRIGWIGFFFFLIKGLIWLAVFFGMGKMVGL